MEDLPAFQKLKAKAVPKGGSLNKSPEGKFWRGFNDTNVSQEVRAVCPVTAGPPLDRPGGFILVCALHPSVCGVHGVVKGSKLTKAEVCCCAS